jgi:hypothetical protein
VREIKRVLKPGGVFGAGDQAANGHLRVGMDPQVEAEIKEVYWRRWVAYRGGDLTTGERLRSILHAVGLERVEMRATYTTNASEEAMKGVLERQLSMYMDAELQKVAIEQGWCKPDFFDRLTVAMNAWAAAPGSVWAVARCEALGWKPL